ncbi:MAG: metalloregulator ArsR/SmtB family transcription factor [Actinomycetota bacterium]|nr:metalloregulator ArsR/SmtB family transcription factor [Actinomycetota bacterium]
MKAAHGELLHIDERQGLALRRGRLGAEATERMAGRLRALSDPTRLGLAISLRGDRELCVCDLSWIVERPQNLTSHHMKVLKSEGIVSARKEGKMTMYRLTDDGRQLLESVIVERGRL